jgi:hypothetical protein
VSWMAFIGDNLLFQENPGLPAGHLLAGSDLDRGGFQDQRLHSLPSPRALQTPARNLPHQWFRFPYRVLFIAALSARRFRFLALRNFQDFSRSAMLTLNDCSEFGLHQNPCQFSVAHQLELFL